MTNIQLLITVFGLSFIFEIPSGLNKC